MRFCRNGYIVDVSVCPLSIDYILFLCTLLYYIFFAFCIAAGIRRILYTNYVYDYVSPLCFIVCALLLCLTVYNVDKTLRTNASKLHVYCTGISTVYPCYRVSSCFVKFLVAFSICMASYI